MLSNEIALVTGASRGIGRAIAAELGRLGAVTVGTATSEAGAAAINAFLAEASVRGVGKVLDVRDGASVIRIVDEITAEFGAPTILVNNAGVTRDNLLLRMKDEEWNEIIDTDLNSVYRTSKAVLRGMMKARRGRIINVGSVVGSMGNAGQSNYAAAKAGMGGFTRSLAREVGSRGITVNLIAPGFIDTAMTELLPQKQREALLSQVPLNRLGRPEDVAAAVAFLASPQSDYITGETIHVNGGLHMT